MQTTRRGFLTCSLGSAAAFAQAIDKIKIVSVNAYPVRVGGLFPGNKPSFSSDFDPKRSRWFGPFAQLTGAIIVEIKTDQGITGYGMGGGGGAAN